MSTQSVFLIAIADKSHVLTDDENVACVNDFGGPVGKNGRAWTVHEVA
jgi:hypothetical protein